MTFLRCSCRSFAAAQRPGASTPVKCTDAHRDGEGRPGESGLPNENSAERQAPSPICLIKKNFSKGAPQEHYGCRRILLNETNHLRPDRRRRFYLALIFFLQIRRLRTNSPRSARLQAECIATASGTVDDRQRLRCECASVLQRGSKNAATAVSKNVADLCNAMAANLRPCRLSTDGRRALRAHTGSSGIVCGYASGWRLLPLLGQ